MFDWKKDKEITDKEADAHRQSNASQDEAPDILDKKLPKKLIMRIDMHVMPTLMLIYLASFLDRVNLSNAFVYGLLPELDMERNNRTSIAIAMLFVTYTLFEIPATIIMKKTKPQYFLPACTLMFGILMTLHGVVSNYAGLVVLRVLMGIFEAGIYPASFYLMSMWYKRREALIRFSFFTAGCSLAGAFGSLMAYAIGYMDGVGGYRPWRWIFILEGLLTVVISAVSFFTVSDFPEYAKWLSEDERTLIVKRLTADQGNSGIDQKFQWRDLLLIFKDWKIFLSAPMYFGVSMSIWGMGYFIPTVVKSYGYTSLQANLHSVIPWAAALVWALGIAVMSDRLGIRSPFLIVSALLAIIGNVMLYSIETNVDAQFAGLFLYLMGCAGVIPIFVCWFSMNLHGHQERVIGIPYMLGIGSTSGIAGAFAFPPEQAPRYRVGYPLGLGFLLLSLVISVIYLVGYSIENKKRRKDEKFML